MYYSYLASEEEVKQKVKQFIHNSQKVEMTQMEK